MQTLVRGQRLKLSDLGLREQLEVTLSVTGPSLPPTLLALWLDEADKALGWDQMVWSGGNRVSPNGALELRSSESERLKVGVNLAGKPAGAAKLTFALAFEDRDFSFAETARTIASGALELAGAARYPFSQADFALEKTLFLGEFYVKDGIWRFRAVGEGFAAGLSRALEGWGLPPNLIALPASGAPQPTPARDPAPSASVAFPERPRQPLELPRTWPGGSAPRIPSGLARGVGLLLVKDASGQSGSGTGFVVSPAGHLLTCAHVLEGATDAVFRLEGTGEFLPLEVLAYSEEHDLALSRLDGVRGALEYLLLEREAPELGDDLGLLGYPLTGTLGEGISYTQGIVNGVREKGGIPYLQIDTGAAPGMSGGPIFRRSSGRVLGLLSGSFHMGGGMLLNVGVDVRNLWRLGWVV